MRAIARRTSRRRAAFTLIEVLMVIATLAILAGIVVPQMTTIIDDAKNSTMLRDLREITAAIERYRMDHNGAAPDLIQNQTLIQMVRKTDIDGNVGNGPEHIYGPYFEVLPPNQLNNIRRVFRVNTAPPSNLSNRVGWVYHPASGQIWAGLYNGAVDTSGMPELIGPLEPQFAGRVLGAPRRKSQPDWRSARNPDRLASLLFSVD